MSIHPGSSLTPASYTPQEEAHQAEMKFRVLRLGRARKAFRLEGPFWLALEILAREKGVSLTEEIQSKLNDLPEGANQTSALRVAAIEEMIGYWRVAESRAARLHWTQVLEAVPTPAFALTESRKIICANGALLAAMRGQRVSADTAPGTISIELPAQPVGEAFRSPQYVTTNALFQSGPFRFSARVRLVAHVNGAGSNRVLIGFLEPQSAS